eukprot:gnl/Chilomastix_caulleri/667.p1 GENE.gnl/Chilomastix_caulleri/667~~gnl/Chilomastix_caulleri/667.p1  ORF type:complete len:300 (+),score=74.15 gnl/Chilomastix_caulleri/667:33-932(+)
MNKSCEEEAQAKWAEGQTLIGKRSLFHKRDNIEKAMKCYEDAANLWHSAANYQRAAEAYEKVALHCFADEESRRESLRHLNMAGQNYSQAQQYVKAIEMKVKYIEAARRYGKAREMGSRCEEIADLYKTMGNKEKAIEYLRNAIECYTGEPNGAITARKTNHRLANLLVELGQYAEAAVIFEAIGMGHLESGLTKFSARDRFLDAFACLLAIGDYTKTEEALRNYTSVDPTLAGTMEEELMRGVQDAVVNGDVDEFTKAVYKYHQVKKMDEMLINIFLKVKTDMVGGDAEEDGASSDEL